MHVVLCNQYYRPAEAPTATLAGDLCEALVQRGHRVTVIASSRAYNDPTTVFPAQETLNGVEVLRTRTSGYGRRGRVGRMIDYLGYLWGTRRRLATIEAPDVVIAMTTPPLLGRWLWPIAERRQAKKLAWIMDVYPDLAFELGVLRRDGWLGRTLSSIESSSLRRADKVVTIGDDMADQLRASGAQQVDVAPNWCDGTTIRPIDRNANHLRQSWGWGDRFVVLYSGNIGLAHEFDTLLDAAERLMGDERLLFAFVGGGARLDAVRQGAAERGLKNVEFRPWVEQEQLAHSLSAGDLHVVTMRPDVHGLLVPSKIYGIFAVGRPTLFIGPSGSTIDCLLREHGCGPSIDCKAVDDVVASIRRYVDDPELGRQHGQAAREAFLEHYDRPRALDRLVQQVEQTVS